jgi:hypothetical protein
MRIRPSGEADLIDLSADTFEQREKIFVHRDKVYAAEIARLSGLPAYTAEQIHSELEALYTAAVK